VRERLAPLYDALGIPEMVEIVILVIVLVVILRFLGKTRATGIIRGLILVLLGLLLVAHVVIAAFDLTILGKILNYLHTTLLVGLLIIFQPELRRGLILLGRYRFLRLLTRDAHPIAEKLADAAEALSFNGIGALVAIQRRMALDQYAETGERIDAEVSSTLIRTLFNPHGPLHDGAVVVQNGRIRAAACQLPLGQPPVKINSLLGMRHRAALCLSEETDSVLLVVSEETGRISLAIAGSLETVPREDLARRLANLLDASPPRRLAA
jgi:diadenylate cyclase